MYKKYFYEISNVVFSLNIKVELFEKYHFTSNKSESWNI